MVLSLSRKGLPRLGSRQRLPSSGPHLILSILCLHKDLHATMEVPPEPWPNLVDGVGSLALKGGGSAGVRQVALAKFLPGMTAMP